MNKAKVNPVLIVSSILSVIWMVWKNWNFICSFKTFPALPNNWKDSNQVRTFFIALMRSDCVGELIKLVPGIKWTDITRTLLAELASNDILWNLVWGIATNTAIHEQDRKLSIRERIRKWRSDRGIAPKDIGFANKSSLEIDAGLTELASAIIALQLAFMQQS
jgi:hypothetical protein